MRKIDCPPRCRTPTGLEKFSILFSMSVDGDLLNRRPIPVVIRKRRESSMRHAFITVVLAGVLVGCGSPVRPTQEDRFPLYSGQWRGVIGEVQVALQIQAERGFGGPSLRGTGTYLNGTSGQNGRLTIGGLGNLDDTSNAPPFLNLSTADELGADGRTITKSGQLMGQFSGNLSGPRTWPGQFKGPRTFGRDYDGIFGVPNAAVTFIKD